MERANNLTANYVYLGRWDACLIRDVPKDGKPISHDK